MPPLAQTTWPVHHMLSCVQSIPTIPAISSTYPGLPPAFLPSITKASASISLRMAMLGECSTNDLKCSLKSGDVLDHMSVNTGPGFMAFTVALSASSRDHVRVMASRAALVPPYMDWPLKPSEEETELRLTIRPLRSCGRYGSVACINNSGPRTLILYWRSNSSTVTSGTNWSFATPALLINISTTNLPVLGCVKLFLVLATRWAGPVGVPISACTTKQRTSYAAVK